MTPLAESSERPVGRVPELTANAGAGDPVAVTVNEYAEPAVAGDVGLPDVISGTLNTAIVYVAVAGTADPLSAFTVKVADSALVGTPEIRPPVERARPSGRLPEETVNVGAGEPVAVTEYE